MEEFDYDPPDLTDFGNAVGSLAARPLDECPSGEYFDFEGSMESRIVQKQTEMTNSVRTRPKYAIISTTKSTPKPLSKQSRHRVRVALSVDFDAVSAHLGTGKHPDNNMADYSQGIFAGRVGVPRLVRLFKKLGLAEKMTWFIPGHSMETFPEEARQIVESGCEIGLHGYSHEVLFSFVCDEKDTVN